MYFAQKQIKIDNYYKEELEISFECHDRKKNEQFIDNYILSRILHSSTNIKLNGEALKAEVKTKEWRQKISKIKFIRGAKCEAINQKQLDVIKKFLLNLKSLNLLEFTFGNLYDRLYQEILMKNQVSSLNNLKVVGDPNSNPDLDDFSSVTTIQDSNRTKNRHQYFKESFQVLLVMKSSADKEFFLLFLKAFLSVKSSNIKSENEKTSQLLEERTQIILGDNQFYGRMMVTLKTDFFVIPKSFEKFTDLKVLHFEMQEQQLTEHVIAQTVHSLNSLIYIEDLAINIKEEIKGYRRELFSPLIQNICNMETLCLLVIKWKYRRFADLCTNQQNMKNLTKIIEICDNQQEQSVYKGIQKYLEFIENKYFEFEFDPFQAKRLSLFPKLTKYKLKFSFKKCETMDNTIQFLKTNYFERAVKDILRYRQNIVYFLCFAQKIIKTNRLFLENTQVLNDLLSQILFNPQLTSHIKEESHYNNYKQAKLSYCEQEEHSGLNENYYEEDHFSNSSDSNQ